MSTIIILFTYRFAWVPDGLTRHRGKYFVCVQYVSNVDTLIITRVWRAKHLNFSWYYSDIRSSGIIWYYYYLYSWCICPAVPGDAKSIKWREWNILYTHRFEMTTKACSYKPFRNKTKLVILSFLAHNSNLRTNSLHFCDFQIIIWDHWQ